MLFTGTSSRPILLLLLSLNIFTGIQCLEISFSLNLQASRLPGQACGVLTCAENITSEESSGTISSMNIFKVVQLGLQDGEGARSSNPVATLTVEKPYLHRVSDAGKVFGSLEGGFAFLSLEMIKEADCTAKYKCQVRTSNPQGRELVHTNRSRESTGRDVDDDLTSSRDPPQTMLLLLQQLDTKLAMLGSSLDKRITALENRFEDKILSVHVEVNSLKSELGNLIETQVVEKLYRLDEVLSSRLGNDTEDATQQEKTEINESLKKWTEELVRRGDEIFSKALGSCENLEVKINDSITLVSSVREHVAGILPSQEKSEKKLDNLTQIVIDLLNNSESLNQLQHNTLEILNETKSTIEGFYSPEMCRIGMTSLPTQSPFPYPVVRPSGTIGLSSPYLCDTSTEGGGWIIIQRRTNGSVDFYRGWEEYKKGFGSLESDFWLGNENIHALSSSGTYELRIDLRYNMKSAFAHYSAFSLDSERKGYALHLGDYSGTAGDSLADHDGQQFSTMDRDNDGSSGNCASTYTGAWWYNRCHTANLNGKWGARDYEGPTWQTLSGGEPVEYSEMKIRRV